jgi:thymidylate kinase
MGLTRKIVRTAATNVRGAGVVEKTLNQAGLLWHRHFAVFDFAKHAEIQTNKDIDHISAGEESSETQTGNLLTHDKLCKWWTVEGLPGAGKSAFADEFCAATGVKNFGTGHLLWELERLKEVCNQPHYYDTWKALYDDGMHYLKMRNVDLGDFFANPNDPIHSCRMQDHMKLQRHIHSMDALRHLLTTAEGVLTNRTHHSDYCYAYAMMKMGYMSKNFYEMRYTVSQATADGSGTATDLTPNCSFFIDISPEEALESIKARGNEQEIATCNLEFLKHLEEAYKTFWSEDMNSKGCTVFQQKKNPNMADITDFIAAADENELRHAYSRWAHATESQKGWNNRSQFWGQGLAFLDHFNDARLTKFHRTKNPLTSWIFPGGKAGNHYEKVLHTDLTKGPAYSYKILHTFHPWNELMESHSMMENYVLLNDKTGGLSYNSTHGITEMNGLDHIRIHPDWQDHDGSMSQKMKIMFGSKHKYHGDEHIQRFTYQSML